MSLLGRIVNQLFPRAPRVVGNIASWARSHQPESLRHIRSQKSVTRIEPLCVHGLDPAFESDREVTLPERCLVEIRNAVIRGRDGYVVLPDGSYCLENTSEKWLLGNPAYFQRIQKKPEFLEGEYFSLLGMHCREHYHWMHDVLGSCFGLLDLLPPQTKIIVPKGLSRDKLDSLRAVGIEPEELLEYDPEVPLILGSLFFAPPAAPHLLDDPDAIQWLRNKLADYYALRPEHSLRLYVARMGTMTRRIANEKEVRSILQEFGFTVVQSEDLTLREQATLFSRAEAIVGPHGAGLTNMLFSKSGCRVLDITAGAVGFRSYFWSLASACDHQYFHLKGDPVIEAYDPEELVVDIDLLVQTLNKMRLA